ncbi:unnamed protein product, partial [Phaeothamnion confervicola]
VVGGGFGQEVSFTATDGTTKTIINDPHNGYIFLLASMGVVGLSAFLFVQLGFAVMATRAIRGSPIGNEIAIWALGSWIVFLAEIFLDVRLTPSNYMVFFWTLTAIPIAL